MKTCLLLPFVAVLALHKGVVQKIDYSNPAKVTDTSATDLPADFLDEAKRQLGVYGVAQDGQAEIFKMAAAPAATPASLTPTASATAVLKPKHEYAQALFRKWEASARTDGKIPGALIGHVAREVDNFIKQYPDDEKTPKLAALRPRFDASHDWTQAEVVALLDDITAISTAPVSWADLPMEFSSMRAVQGGQPLPIELTSAAWGQPMANGLRAAWLLEPRAEQYALGSVLKARVLFHNAGKAPVVFKTETWHQDDHHTARDAKGAEIKVGGSWFTGITPMATFRLAPGEYCEVMGHGIAIGAGKYEEETSTGSVGAVIEAKVGDAVSLSHSVDTAEGGWSRPDDPKDPMELWKKTIAERIANEAPMPASAADREQLIRRVTRDIFGEPPGAEEIATFTADETPDALAKLTGRLQAKQRIGPFSGKLPTGETKFRVIAADPNAAKAPRTANAPGRYVLGDNVHLLVSQTTTDARRENKAVIAFLSPDPKVVSPYKSHEIALPDGIGTYGIVWDRGTDALWVMQRNLVRKYEFANPAQVQEMKIAPGSIFNIPAHMQEAMKKAFDLAGGPVQQQNSQAPKGGAELAPDTEAQLDWGDTVDGLRGAVVVRSPAAGEPPGIFLAVQNVAQTPLRFADTIAVERLRTMYVSASGRILFALTNGEPTKTDVTLEPREVVYLPMMPPAKSAEEKTPEAALIEGIRKDSLQTWKVVLEIQNAPEGAWKGRLTTAETRGAVGLETPQPKNPKAQALFKVWQSNARLNGDIAGGLVRLLHEKVKEFIRNNEKDASGGPYAKKMTPLEPRFANGGDWKPADVVVLLDDIAAAHTIPLETTMEHLARHSLQRGLPLPASLGGADWGEPLPGGLRMGYMLEPRAKEYRLGTELKARILLHNSGKDPVAFVTTGFQQPRHTARLAGGGELTLDSTFWTTLGRMEAYRLAPGEYCEIYTPGLGIGAQNKDRDDWSNVRAGSWIPCAAGNDVVFTPGAAMLFYENDGGENPNWWLDFITERLNREAPVPADTKEREYLLYRVVRELYGAAPSTTEGDAFAADKSPDALKNLAALLAKNPFGTRSHGLIRAGTTTFRVLPPDPDAAKRPRVANNPGWFTTGDDVRFSVTRHAAGERAVNEGSIVHFPKGKDNIIHKVALPDGYQTWAAAWVKGTTVMWVTQKGLLRKFDFTNPAKIVETRYEGDKAADASIPADVREAMRAVLADPDAPKQIQEPPNPAAPGTTPAPAPAAEKPKDAAAKLEPTGLLGFWRGKMNGEDLLISFHRPPVETDMQVDIYFGRATIGVPAAFTIAPDGGSVTLMTHSANGRVPFGRLFPVEAGTLRFESSDEKHKLPGGIVLTRDREEPATEPRQKEARELFAMWKITANDDGTIPGTFIGMLAAEVRAYVKANPTLDSGMKLPKLLPRFVTSRDWTAEEAIKLLDDVAYYATKPIEARVAKAQLPSGPLWRTMVSFEDIPVAIAKWSEAKNGLRIGMRVVEDEWRIGGKVKIEMWLHNAGEKDVSFKSTGPDRQDAGVAVSAVGADGREHWAESGNVSLIAIPLHCTLPAGHVAKAKDVTLSFDAPDNKELAWFAPKFRELAPGKYKLRCQWSDPHPSISTAGDWTGVLAAPEVDFMLAAQVAPEKAGADAAPGAKPATQLAKLPDDAYPKSGVPIGEFNAGAVNWSAEQNGLCLAMSVEEDAQWKVGGEVKVALWVCNPGEKDVKFQHCARRDIGLRVLMKGTDGKERAADIAQFDAYPVAFPVLLPAGHIFKAKEFSVVFLPPGGKAAGAEPHFTLAAGGYKFRSELELPGLTATGADGKQRTPAEGEWTGTLKSGEVDVKLLGADAPAAETGR